MAKRNPLDRARKLCLALPEAAEKLAWGEPTFRCGANGKMFVMFANNHHNDGRIAIWCNAAPGTQDLLVRANPDRFFVPPYQGTLGWVGVRLEDGIADWDEIAEVVEEAYRLTAPKRLLALLDARSSRP